jgi:hypothetical protein
MITSTVFFGYLLPFPIRPKIFLSTLFPNILSLCSYLSNNDNNDSLIPQSVLSQVHSLFPNKFSIQCDLVLPLSMSSILSFP